MVIFYFTISYIIGTKVVNNVFGTNAHSRRDNHFTSTSSQRVREKSWVQVSTRKFHIHTLRLDNRFSISNKKKKMYLVKPQIQSQKPLCQQAMQWSWSLGLRHSHGLVSIDYTMGRQLWLEQCIASQGGSSVAAIGPVYFVPVLDSRFPPCNYKKKTK